MTGPAPDDPEPGRVVPGGSLPVTVVLTNNGTSTWSTADTKLVLTSEGFPGSDFADFANANLKLTAATKPGKNGTFTGSFTPVGGRNTSMKGVFLQKADEALGQFFGVSQSGSVHVAPAP